MSIDLLHTLVACTIFLAGDQTAYPGVAQIYFAPSYLQGEVTDVFYRRWLTRKAKYIIAQDRERNRACVKNATDKQYKELIHKAVTDNGRFDPFTGDTLRWNLVCTWDDSIAKNLDESGFEKFALLPTVDHVDPYSDEIAFEICSWRINRMKNNLTADEFVALCRRIVTYWDSRKNMAGKKENKIQLPAEKYGSPQLYFLPPFLQGFLTEDQYIRWLARKASHLYHADKKQKRPCAVNATARLYKQLIHRAVLSNGLADPFTGDTLRWDLLGTWDDSLTKNPDEALVKKYSLLPTVNHIDPFGNEIGFEMCSWLVNRCKSDMTAEDFVAQCRRIVAFKTR